MVSVLEDLLCRETFVDVTLVCEGMSIKAHKVVLSACSPFFQALFADNPCAHPIVIMNQTKHSDLKAVVEFMYKGEVNVVQDQLPTLLQTADALKVKGLAEVTANECPTLATESPPPHLPARTNTSHHPAPQVPPTSAQPSKRKHTPPLTHRKPSVLSEEELSLSPASHDGPSTDPEFPQTQASSKTRGPPKQPAPANRRTFDHSYSDDKTNWVPPESDPNLRGPGLGGLLLPSPAVLQQAPPVPATSSLPPAAPLPPPVPPPPVPPPEPRDDYVTMDDGPSVQDESGGTVCSVCSRVFSTRGNLKRHMLMHRPYRHKHQCTLCLKMFSWPGDLRTHLRVAHGQGKHRPGRLQFLPTLAPRPPQVQMSRSAANILPMNYPNQ